MERGDDGDVECSIPALVPATQKNVRWAGGGTWNETSKFPRRAKACFLSRAKEDVADLVMARDAFSVDAATDCMMAELVTRAPARWARGILLKNWGSQAIESSTPELLRVKSIVEAVRRDDIQPVTRTSLCDTRKAGSILGSSGCGNNEMLEAAVHSMRQLLHGLPKNFDN